MYLQKVMRTQFRIAILFQAGSFGTMPNLRTLKLTLGSDNADLNLASLLSANPALRHLHIHITPGLITASKRYGPSFCLQIYFGTIH